MALNYRDILSKYYEHANAIHQLLVSNDKRNKKNLVKILKKKITKLKNFLRKNSKIFDNSKLSLVNIREFIDKVVKPICRDLSKIVHLACFLNETDEIMDILIEFSKSLHDFGCSNLSKNIFSNLIEKINDYVKLSDILDLVLECGYLDLALNTLRKMREQGLVTFATAYNEALIKYLLGEDLEALKLVKIIIKRYGLRSELLGLLSAIYIGVGDLSSAKETLSILRGK